MVGRGQPSGLQQCSRTSAATGREGRGRIPLSIAACCALSHVWLLHGDGFTHAAASHPAKALLFPASRGRLGEAMLAQLAATLKRTIELLRAVGAEAELPLPPNPDA
jgi:hypothetical protein